MTTAGTVVARDEQDNEECFTSPYEEQRLGNTSSGAHEISFSHHPSFFEKARACRSRRGRDFYGNDDKENQTRQSSMNLIYEEECG